MTLPTGACTYSAQWSPHEDEVVSAVSGDGVLRIFDLRTPASARYHLVLSVDINVQPGAQVPRPGVPPPMAAKGGLPSHEALTHDWNKYRHSIIATGGVDGIIRTWDLRNLAQGPAAILHGHEYAVRKVTWSPHLSDVLLSASYDMSCRVWNDGTAVDVAAGRTTGTKVGSELGKMERHTEFATGVDWCLFGAEGWCASTAWDERVLVWDVRSAMGR
jgi:peroxin-7